MLVISKRKFKFARAGGEVFVTKGGGEMQNAPDWLRSNAFFQLARKDGDVIVAEDTKVSAPQSAKIRPADPAEAEAKEAAQKEAEKAAFEKSLAEAEAKAADKKAAAEKAAATKKAAADKAKAEKAANEAAAGKK